MPNKDHQSLLSIAESIISRSTAQTRNAAGHAPGIDWVMSVIDEEGYPAASMITAAKAEGFRYIAFCTGLGWNKPNRLTKNPRSCIYLFDEESFTGISLVGKTEVLTDIGLKQEMWYPELADVFTGPEDERWCVLLFRPEKYNIFIENQTIRGTFSDDTSRLPAG